IRITEQGEQQKRLARSQAFYKALGDTANNLGNQLVNTVGSGLRRVLLLERNVNNDYEQTYPRANSRILAEQSAFATGLQARTQRGLLGVATGQSALTGVFPAVASVGIGASVLKGLNVVSDFTSGLAELQVASGASVAEMARVSA